MFERIAVILLIGAGLAAACETPPSTDGPVTSASVTASAAGGPLAALAAPSTGERLAPVVFQGATIARAPNSSALYVAHEDLEMVEVVPLPIGDDAPVRAVKMPGPPAALLAMDGLVLVTVRDPGLLVALRPDDAAGMVEVARVEVPGDAWGLAITRDLKTAVVTSAWTHKVTGIDLGTMKQLWSLDVRREPRAVVVRPDDQSVYVTHLVSADLTRIDGVATTDPILKTVPFPAAPVRTPPAAKPSLATARSQAATLGYTATLSPDGSRLFVPRQALGATGILTWNGFATVDILLTRDDSMLAVQSKSQAVMWTGDFPRAFQDGAGMFNLNDAWITGPGWTQRHAPFAQARAAVYRASTDTLLVADEGNDTLVELEALSIDPSSKSLWSYDLGRTDERALTTDCGAPSGVALSSDESVAYVFCRSTHDVVEVRLSSFDPKHAGPPAPRARARLTKEPLDEQAALGRRLFFNARDDAMSENFACSGCHPDGRDDGHVWHQDEQGPGASEGTAEEGRLHAYEIEGTQEPGRGAPRQTPMLAGRVAAAGPYGWKSRSPTLRHRVLTGFTIHRWFGGWAAGDAPERIKRAEAIAAFLRTGLRPPPRAAAPLTTEQQRGKTLFEDPTVGCAVCHDPATDTTKRQLADLGPLPLDESRFDREVGDDLKFKTPSLSFASGTPPYYHDGSVPTLELLIDLNGKRMGNTAHLSAEDRKALVAFLRTL